MHPIATRSIPISVLLIDDQLIIAEAIRRMLADETDIHLHYCKDPEKAILMAAEVVPTVILQDLVMPEVDGLTLVRYFRANPATQDVPLIVLSSKEEPRVKAEAFSLGANDYLVKLPDKVELVARIRYHSAAYTRLLERNLAYDQLEESQKHLQSELADAAQYVRSLFPDPIETPVSLDWRYIPSQYLGGDAFDYEWLDSDHLAIYLLDVCGHGVAAALLSITLMHAIRSQSLGTVDYRNPKELLTALNKAFPMEKYHNMFFTMWYGILNTKKRELVYSAGGHPPAVLFSGDSPDKLETAMLKTNGFIVGGLEDAVYENAVCQLKTFNKLFIFSDGIYELERPDGKMLKLDEFVELLEQTTHNQKDGLSEVLKYVKKINQDRPFVDDVSIIELVL